MNPLAPNLTLPVPCGANVMSSLLVEVLNVRGDAVISSPPDPVVCNLMSKSSEFGDLRSILAPESPPISMVANPLPLPRAMTSSAPLSIVSVVPSYVSVDSPWNASVPVAVRTRLAAPVAMKSLTSTLN